MNKNFKVKGRYTIETFDKNNNKVDEIISDNIVLTKTLEETLGYLAYLPQTIDNPEIQPDDYAFSKNNSNCVIPNSPNILVLSDLDEEESNDLIDFTSNIIGYADRGNNNNSDYNSKYGYLESYTSYVNGAKMVFKFPENSANGTIKSIMMCPGTMVDKTNMKVKQKGFKLSSCATNKFYRNNVLYRDGEFLYYFKTNNTIIWRKITPLTNKIIEEKTFNNVNQEILDTFSSTTTTSVHTAYYKCLIPYKNKYVYIDNSNIYLLNEDLSNIIDKKSLSYNSYSHYSNGFIYEKEDKLYIDKYTITINDNTINVENTLETSIINQIITSLNTSSTGIIFSTKNKYICKILDNGEIIAKDIETGETVSSSSIISENDILYGTVNNTNGMLYFSVYAKVQPYSYTKLPVPVLNTSDKFMKITYETFYNSDLLNEIYELTTGRQLEETSYNSNDYALDGQSENNMITKDLVKSDCMNLD